jgi:hypothetical protein
MYMYVCNCKFWVMCGDNYGFRSWLDLGFRIGFGLLLLLFDDFRLTLLFGWGEN